MNSEILLLKMLMYLDFLISGSGLFDSFIVEGKKVKKFEKRRANCVVFDEGSNWKR